MKKILASIIVGLLISCGAIPTNTNNGPPPFNDCLTACVVLNSIGCSEGKSPNCVSVCNQVVGDNFTNPNLTCLVKAKSKSDVVNCGTFVSCN